MQNWMKNPRTKPWSGSINIIDYGHAHTYIYIYIVTCAHAGAII